MFASSTPESFVQKWRGIQQKESAIAKEHFIDLCRILGQPTPTEADPTGKTYAFEYKVKKTTGRTGYADVWKRGHFAWEYKGRRANLEAAYTQLLLYREDLENPPLLTVCDTERFEIHTNFTGTPKKIYRFTLDDLPKPENLDLLHYLFTDPDKLNPKYKREKVTKEATAKLGELAQRLQARGYSSEEVAHFTMRLVFALFAEDVRLLPNEVFKTILGKTRNNPTVAKRYFDELFLAMATGGIAALEEIPYFNGGLFDGGEALALESQELAVIYDAAELDWSEVEPAIFGTLFERSLDPSKRSQLGAHYTSREDILRIVQPVIAEPLRSEWQSIRQSVEVYLEQHPLPDERTLDRKRLASFNALKRQRNEWAHKPIAEFLQRLRDIKVLDPACGSGNFLYVAFQQLKELERDVLTFSQSIGYPQAPFVSPKQFYGLEVNVFAYELASIVVWIGYLQWNYLNGYSNHQVPILERLSNIRLQDALLDGDKETEWPEANFIIGNPPFLGDKRMRSELGNEYVEKQRKLFRDRVLGQADFVCYWFEKARVQIEVGKTQRAGLISTNSIRGGTNRKVLERIKETGDIFMVWPDEPWILDGAAVRVSLIGFDDGAEDIKMLNGQLAAVINSDLTGSLDLSRAVPLEENRGKAFQGPVKVGAFDIPGELARSWLNLPNLSGKDNADVLKPWVNGMDIMRRPSDTWIIDFGQLSLDEAEAYLIPLEYVREHVKPFRDKNNDRQRRTFWWRLGRSGEELKKATLDLERVIATPRVAKHRVFRWLPKGTVPDSRVFVIAKQDDCSYGVLNSKVHEVWTFATCSWHGVGNDPTYNAGSCFETFPFPRPDDAQKAEIEKWAKYLDAVRTQLLEADSKRTLTKLYNALEMIRETRDSSSPVYPLLLAHEKLDAAVAAAYGWE